MKLWTFLKRRRIDEDRNPKLRQSRTICSSEDGMRIVYHKMGLSENEIAERILCKYTKILERKGNLDECDKMKVGDRVEIKAPYGGYWDGKIKEIVESIALVREIKGTWFTVAVDNLRREDGVWIEK